jgi:hypothetical protein
MKEEERCTGVGGRKGRYMKPGEWSMWGKKDNAKEARDPK